MLACLVAVEGQVDYPIRQLFKRTTAENRIKLARQALLPTYTNAGLEAGMREALSPEQFAQYDANSYFEVTGCHSGKRYRISHGTSMNIHELDGAGCPCVGWCFTPKGYLAAGDVMLAQKIALETDERRALAVANNFFVQTGRRNTLLHH